MDLDNLFSLEGKIALVTGAAGGLGREISLGLSHYGASMVISDVVSLEKTQEDLQKKGRSCIAVKADITHEKDVKNLMHKAVEAYGQIDILVNNAGVVQAGDIGTQDLDTDTWDHVIDINMKGAFLCCKHVGKLMTDAGTGSIINIASTAGIAGIPKVPAYCASKAGIISMTKSLALEWARYNIRVNAIAPHYLETDLTKGVREIKKVNDSLINQIPLKRFGKPSEIIGAALYLSSNASTFTTGAVIPVDGGFLSQ